MSELRDKYAIVGTGKSKLGRVEGVSALGLLEDAMKQALDQAGLTNKDVDGIVCRGPDDIYSHHQLMGQRLGINIVSGWNVEEFAMFGIPLREHDERYDYSAEWVSILKRVHSETGPFDHDGKYFHLKNVNGKPKPWGQGRPTLMSAGSSPAGRRFAVKHTDCLFMVITEEAKIASDVAQARAVPGADKVGLYASGHLLCRRTAKETKEYYHYLVQEKGDWEAAENIIAKRAAGNSQSLSPELMRKMMERVISGGATFPVIGSYDEVAEKFLRLSEAGLDGMALILVNYVNEMPVLRDEVLPRLERLKIRQSRGH